MSPPSYISHKYMKTVKSKLTLDILHQFYLGRIKVKKKKRQRSKNCKLYLYFLFFPLWNSIYGIQLRENSFQRRMPVSKWTALALQTSYTSLSPSRRTGTFSCILLPLCQWSPRPLHYQRSKSKPCSCGRVHLMGAEGRPVEEGGLQWPHHLVLSTSHPSL